MYELIINFYFFLIILELLLNSHQNYIFLKVVQLIGYLFLELRKVFLHHDFYFSSSFFK